MRRVITHEEHEAVVAHAKKVSQNIRMARPNHQVFVSFLTDQPARVNYHDKEGNVEEFAVTLTLYVKKGNVNGL